jgi:hypothetical protein
VAIRFLQALMFARRHVGLLGKGALPGAIQAVMRFPFLPGLVAIAFFTWALVACSDV